MMLVVCGSRDKTLPLIVWRASKLSSAEALLTDVLIAVTQCRQSRDCLVEGVTIKTSTTSAVVMSSSRVRTHPDAP